MKSFRLYFTLVLVLLTTNLFSQNNWEVEISPRPYEGKPYYGNIVSTPLKKVIIISHGGKSLPKNDTLSIINYNTKGFIFTNLSYEKGKANSKYTFRYDNKNTYLGNNEEHLKKSSVDSYTKIGYNKNKIRNTEYDCSIRNKDTIQRIFRKYTYNDQNQLTAREDFYKNELSLKDEYIYNNKLLTTKKSFNYPFNPKKYSETQLSYSSVNLLSDEIDLQINDATIDTTSTVHYSYSNGKLTEQNLIIFNTNKKNRINTKYSYNSCNDLENIFVTRDLDTLKVDYSYDSNCRRIIKKAESNTKNSFPECNMAVNLFVLNPKLTFEYTEEYLYDNKGNIIEKKYLLNGDLINKITYILEYY